MLNTNREREPADYDVPEARPPAELFVQLWNIARQQLPIILGVTALACALGAWYVYITPPTFSARATLIIDRGKVHAQLGGMLRELQVDSGEAADSQIQLIKSEAVALAVVDKLSLAGDPEFIGPPVGLAGLIHQLRSKLSSDDRPSVPFDLRAATAAALASRLTVNRVGGYAIEIETHSLDPERAAQLANAFADCYVEDQLKSRYQSANQAAGWLKDQIQVLGDQSALADQSVVQFKAKNNIVAAGGRLLNEQQLGELNTQLLLAREKTNETKARLDRIEAIVNSDPSNNKVVGTVADTLSNPIIVRLRSQYLELVARESDWSRRFGADHLAVANLVRQIRELRDSITDELQRIAETYKSDYEIAKQRQANLEATISEALSQFQEANQAQVELRQLESSAETYRSLYKSALQRNTELIQQQSFPGTEARLITRASPPPGKSAPKTPIILSVSAVGGMLLGLGLGFLRVSLDRVFRTAEQIETALQANCLALAPMTRRSRRRELPAPTAPRTIAPNATVSWGVIDRPLSRFAEAMRSVKSAARLSRQKIKVFGFTSSLPGEGKSTLGTAFALLSAQAGARVLLVDCDFRHPALSKALAPGAEHGILEVISDRKKIEEVLWTDAQTNLSFLPGAMRSPVPDSAEILSSDALRSFFEAARKEYDCIVVDLPPIAPIVDVRSTAGLVDSYVFVVEWGRTKMDVVDLALHKAPMVHENLLGVVLNKVDFKSLARYNGYHGDYYSDKIYAQYGNDRPR
jgi:succinoglycan biosynthesis transport protein ExoP